MEIFKQIPDFPNYEVSNYGNVKSYFNSKIIIRKPVADAKGYLRLILYKNGKANPKKLHRLVAQVFIPNPNNLPQVNHKDGDKTNNHVSNLEWISNIENMRHSFNELGREGSSKEVTKHRVLELIEMYKTGVKVADIANHYGIAPRNVYKILHGKSYKQIDREIFRVR